MLLFILRLPRLYHKLVLGSMWLLTRPTKRPARGNLWKNVCDPPFSLVPLVLLPRTGNYKSELLLLSLGPGARDTTVASVLFWLHLYKLEQAEMKRKVKCSRLKPQRRFTRSDKKPTSHLSPYLPLVWSFIRKKPEFDEQRIFFKVLRCFISNEQPQD